MFTPSIKINKTKEPDGHVKGEAVSGELRGSGDLSATETPAECLVREGSGRLCC